MARIVSVFLPTWPIDRPPRQEDAPSDKPPVLAGRAGNRRLTGTVHFHGCEACMPEALLGRLALSGITAQAAIAAINSRMRCCRTHLSR